MGGQITNAERVENYPGFPKGISGLELGQLVHEQATSYGLQTLLGEFTRVVPRKRQNLVTTSEGDLVAESIIIASGSQFRRLGVPGEDEFTGKGVSYCATCDGPFFRDAEVAVVGGGDNALTEAVFLTKFCRKLFVIHRRDQFRAIKILQERVLANPKIEVLWNCVLESAEGESRLERVMVRNVKEDRTFPLRLDGLFISVGMDPHTGFIKGAVGLNEWGEVKVDSRMATDQPGIYAAGDVADACPKQVATAVGAGVNAALSVNEYLESLP